jgi:hypothetical protein
LFREALARFAVRLARESSADNVGRPTFEGAEVVVPAGFWPVALKDAPAGGVDFDLPRGAADSSSLKTEFEAADARAERPDLELATHATPPAETSA